MVINVIDGDALASNDRFFVHQVNCLGIMGGGIAAQVKRQYPSVYEIYRSYLDAIGDRSKALGTIAIANCRGKIFYNLFGQNGIGSDYSPFPNGRQTDYTAFTLGMEAVKKNISELIDANQFKADEISIAMPYKIGCGLAKGDWNIILELIIQTFSDTDYTINFYKLN